MGATAEPWELPEGWAWARLGDLGIWTGGGTPSKSNSEYWENGTIPWVSPKDMKVHVIGETEDTITEAALAESAAKLVSPGSVLMVMRSGILRHSFPVAVTDRPVALNQDLRALTPHEWVLPEYVARFLSRASHAILDACSKDGTTVNSIDTKGLAKFPVPIAPLAEQRRIVARIDELFAEIAEGEAALAEARKGLEVFRRALLKAAVSGDLTLDRREKPQALAANDGGRDGNLATLAAGWKWSTLGELAASVRNGSSVVPRAAQTKFEMLRIAAVRPMKIDPAQIRYLDEHQAKNLGDATVQEGDLLFTRYNGSKELVGVAAVYRDAPRFYPDKLIRVRLREDLSAYADFIAIAVSTGASRKFISSNVKTTAGQQGISGASLKATPIPVPPPEELAEILKRVAQAIGAVEDAGARLGTEASDSTRLRQSTLKAAFEGRLVPQDATDEPAAEVLTRLKQEGGPTHRRQGREKVTA